MEIFVKYILVTFVFVILFAFCYFDKQKIKRALKREYREVLPKNFIYGLLESLVENPNMIFPVIRNGIYIERVYFAGATLCIDVKFTHSFKECEIKEYIKHKIETDVISITEKNFGSFSHGDLINRSYLTDNEKVLLGKVKQNNDIK